MVAYSNITKLEIIIPTLNIILKSLFIARGSPSLVGRGIANPMFERTRGFKSHSPRSTLVVRNPSQFHSPIGWFGPEGTNMKFHVGLCHIRSVVGPGSVGIVLLTQDTL